MGGVLMSLSEPHLGGGSSFVIGCIIALRVGMNRGIFLGEYGENPTHQNILVRGMIK
jgi:hypothetical protein